MDKYYEQINELVQDLLIPARTQKIIDKDAFKKFCDIIRRNQK